MRVLLIGGTSNTGKSTIGRAAADRLGFEYRSTDSLARHPGRPWRTPDWEVPPHVAEHYRTLTVDELIDSVLAHYGRLWPRIEQIVTERDQHRGGRGLVLEGSALLPARVAMLGAPRTAAVWLRSDEPVLRRRIHEAGGYAGASEGEQLLMDRFLARSLRFQSIVQADLDELGLPALDTGDDVPLPQLVTAAIRAAEPLVHEA